MGLGSDKLTVGEKNAIAEAMMAVKEDFDIKKVNKDYSKFDVLKVWPEGEPRPSLAKFVNQDSWLMFHLLDLPGCAQSQKTEKENQERYKSFFEIYSNWTQITGDITIISDMNIIVNWGW